MLLYSILYHMQSFCKTTAGTVELLAHLESVYMMVAGYWATEAEAFESDCKQPEKTGAAVTKPISLKSEDKEPADSSEAVTNAKPLESDYTEPADSGEAVTQKCEQPKGSSEANAEAEVLEHEGKEPTESTEEARGECKEPKNSNDGEYYYKRTEDKIATWNKAKAEIDAYAMRLSKASNSFNFQTEAKPPEARKVKFEKFDYSLCVPTTINLQENNIPITKTTASSYS